MITKKSRERMVSLVWASLFLFAAWRAYAFSTPLSGFLAALATGFILVELIPRGLRILLPWWGWSLTLIIGIAMMLVNPGKSPTFLGLYGWAMLVLTGGIFAVFSALSLTTKVIEVLAERRWRKKG